MSPNNTLPHISLVTQLDSGHWLHHCYRLLGIFKQTEQYFEKQRITVFTLFGEINLWLTYIFQLNVQRQEWVFLSTEKKLKKKFWHCIYVLIFHIAPYIYAYKFKGEHFAVISFAYTSCHRHLPGDKCGLACVASRPIPLPVHKNKITSSP